MGSRYNNGRVEVLDLGIVDFLPFMVVQQIQVVTYLQVRLLGDFMMSLKVVQTLFLGKWVLFKFWLDNFKNLQWNKCFRHFIKYNSKNKLYSFSIHFLQAQLDGNCQQMLLQPVAIDIWYFHDYKTRRHSTNGTENNGSLVYRDTCSYE